MGYVGFGMVLSRWRGNKPGDDRLGSNGFDLNRPLAARMRVERRGQRARAQFKNTQ